MLPGRAEFGGLITNLEHELKLAGVQIRRSARVDRAAVLAAAPDVVLIATGAKPYRPDFPQEGALQIVDAWQVLRGQATVGQSVVVIDWRADWIGIGIAEHLAQQGRSVRLAVSGGAAGETPPPFVGRHSAAGLHQLGGEGPPDKRPYGSGSGRGHFEHPDSGQAEGIDKV